MRAWLVGLLIAAPAAAQPLETRCGWYANPTPGNHWLTDADASWTLHSQGGAMAPGWDTVEISGTPEWVRTNGYYGYGCACARMAVRDGEVVRIASMRWIPLARCEADPALDAP